MGQWRRGVESNHPQRLCRPLPRRSGTAPPAQVLTMLAEARALDCQEFVKNNEILLSGISFASRLACCSLDSSLI